MGRHAPDSGYASVAERGYTSDSGVYDSQPGSPQTHHHQLNLLNEHVGTQGGWTLVSGIELSINPTAFSPFLILFKLQTKGGSKVKI